MPKKSEIDRMLVLFYRSNNAHDFTNFIRPSGWLDKLPMEGLIELRHMFEVMQQDVETEMDRREAAGQNIYSPEWYAKRAAAH